MTENREWTPGPLPAGIARRALGSCIGNSVETALDHWPTLDYAEGLARSRRSGLWYRHAWNVADDDVLVDTTWELPGLRYIGRVVPLEEVQARAEEKGAYWYMDETAFPWVPKGEAGLDCYTEEQWRWLERQLHAS